ncbi:unnamed protein product [marine sediment metagenome]|uniref:Uncharacterized protein n=1 Tax=marine sediment metagenome TaxID=412755 RepID=X0UBR5_9ZZZZ
MCQIVCQTCQQPIQDDNTVLEIREGFVENGEFTPESELGYYHSECYPINQPTEDK